MNDDPHGRARWIRTLWLLVLLAAVWRLGYVLEYAGELPFIDGPLYDSVVYLRQARAVTEGDFGHPTLLAFGPLYGWFLAALGPMVIPVQLLMGLTMGVMVWRIAATSMRWRDATVAAALWMTYGLLPFYETKIMAETLGTTLLVAGVWAWSSTRYRGGHVGLGIAAGVLLGLATLARANLLLSLPFFILAAVLPWDRRRAERAVVRLRRAGAVTAGLAVVLLANGSWNAIHTGRFVPVILVSRTASVAAASDWDGDLSAFGGEGAASPSAWDVVGQARHELVGDSPSTANVTFDVRGFVANAPQKLAGTIRDVETTYQYGYFGERSEILALDLLPTSFGALLILGLVGAVAVVRRRGAAGLVPYLPLVLGVLATTTLFHPSSRYRLPLVVPLVLLSGHAVPLLVEAWRRSLATRLSVIVIAGACLVSAAGVTFYQLRSPAGWQLRVARGELERGDLERAVRRAQRARRLAEDADTRARAERMLDLLGQ